MKLSRHCTLTALIGFLLLVPVLALAQSTDPNTAPIASGSVDTEAGVRPQSESLTNEYIRTLTDQQKADLLSLVAARNDVDTLRRLLDFGIPVDSQNTGGTTALASAVLTDSLSSAEVLMEEGADPAVSRNGMTVSDLAKLSGSAEMAALVAGGETPDESVYLRRAARDNDVAEVTRLLKDGADPKKVDDGGNTALIDAAMAGALDTMQLLIKEGADINQTASDGLSPAVASILNGDVAALSILLEAGLDPNGKSRGVPLLGLAVTTGRAETVDLLLTKGADPEQKSDDGARPAGIAKAMGLDELARKLGGVPELESSPELFIAIEKGNSEELDKALKQGANPNQVGPDGTPALIAAAASGNAEAVAKLIDAGADPMVRGPGDSTVIHVASASGNHSAAKAIAPVVFKAVRAKSEEDAIQLLTAQDSQGRSTLTRMVISPPVQAQSYVDTIDDIRGLGTIASKPDGDGVSPLLAAVLSDQREFVRIFMASGVSTSVSSGPSLQDLARARGSWGVLAALPDDRQIPEGFKKGATKTIKMAVQQSLKDWGYYSGPVDGSFGAGSVAALKTFLFDRKEELIKLEPYKAIGVREFPNAAIGEEKLTITGPKLSWCEWKVVEWAVKKGSNRSDQFIGCVGGHKKWNGNGFAYVHYANGAEQICLFGPGGWDDKIELK